MAAAERSGDAGGRRRPYAAARRSAIHFTAVLVLAFVHRCDARFAVLPPHVDSNPGWTYEVGGDAAADWRISPDTVAAAAAASGVGDDAMQDAVSPWWWPVDTDYPRHHRTKSHKYAGERLSSNSVWKRRKYMYNRVVQPPPDITYFYSASACYVCRARYCFTNFVSLSV